MVIGAEWWEWMFFGMPWQWAVGFAVVGFIVIGIGSIGGDD